MARRSKDWNEGLAEDLQNPAFAREFLAAAVEDGVPLQLALGKVIRATGVKELQQPSICPVQMSFAPFIRDIIRPRKRLTVCSSPSVFGSASRNSSDAEVEPPSSTTTG